MESRQNACGSMASVWSAVSVNYNTAPNHAKLHVAEFGIRNRILTWLWLLFSREVSISPGAQLAICRMLRLIIIYIIILAINYNTSLINSIIVRYCCCSSCVVIYVQVKGWSMPWEGEIGTQIRDNECFMLISSFIWHCQWDQVTLFRTHHTNELPSTLTIVNDSKPKMIKIWLTLLCGKSVDHFNFALVVLNIFFFFS